MSLFFSVFWTLGFGSWQFEDSAREKQVPIENLNIINLMALCPLYWQQWVFSQKLAQKIIFSIKPIKEKLTWLNFQFSLEFSFLSHFQLRLPTVSFETIF